MHSSRQEQFPRQAEPSRQEPHSHHREQRGLVLLSWLLVVAVAVGIFLMSSRNAGELDHGTGIVSLIRTWLIQAATMLLRASGRRIAAGPLF